MVLRITKKFLISFPLKTIGASDIEVVSPRTTSPTRLRNAENDAYKSLMNYRVGIKINYH